MGYEVDFMAVGDGERSGDAICLRFGNLYGQRNEQFVMVIDGGTQESGEALVEHIRKHYGTKRVDLVVSTHPDNDHVSGLRPVMEQLDVGRLWVHLPWMHAPDVRAIMEGRSDKKLKDAVKKSLDTANELVSIAKKKGVHIDEPFSDVNLPFSDLGIRVLGPSTAYYRSLLPQFRDIPREIAQPGIVQRAFGAVSEAIKWVAESWHIETLTDPDPADETSAENNSSVILTIECDGKRLLFTGDAGCSALTHASRTAQALGISLPSCSLVQVPHHGSRRNCGPTVLNEILGPKYQEPASAKTAFVSAAKEAPKHPARKVVNAFHRRGAKDRVYATQGRCIRHHHDAPERAGWTPITTLPFYEQVEE